MSGNSERFRNAQINLFDYFDLGGFFRDSQSASGNKAFRVFDYNSRYNDVSAALEDDFRQMFESSGIKGKFENSYYYDVYERIRQEGFRGQFARIGIEKKLGSFLEKEQANGRLNKVPLLTMQFYNYVTSVRSGEDSLLGPDSPRYRMLRDELDIRKDDWYARDGEMKERNRSFFRLERDMAWDVPYVNKGISSELKDVAEALESRGFDLVHNRNLYRGIVEELQKRKHSADIMSVVDDFSESADASREHEDSTALKMRSLVEGISVIRDGSINEKTPAVSRNKVRSARVFVNKVVRKEILKSVQAFQNQGLAFKKAVEKVKENAAAFVSRTGRSVAYTRGEINRVVGLKKKAAREKMESFVKSVGAVKDGTISKAVKARDAFTATGIAVIDKMSITPEKVKSAMKNAGVELKKAIDAEKDLHYMTVRENILERQRKEQARYERKMAKLDEKFNKAVEKSKSRENIEYDKDTGWQTVHHADRSETVFDENGVKVSERDKNGFDGKLVQVHDEGHDVFYADGKITREEKSDGSITSYDRNGDERKAEVKKIEALPTLSEISSEDARNLKDSLEAVYDSKNLVIAGKGKYIVNTPAVLDEKGKPFTGVNNFILLNDIAAGGEQKYMSADGNYHFKQVSSVDEYREIAGSGKRGLYSVIGEKDKGQNFILVKDESAVPPARKQEYVLQDPDIGAEAFLGTCLFCAQNGLNLVVAEEALKGIKKSMESRLSEFTGSLSEIQGLSASIEKSKDSVPLLEEKKPLMLGKDFDDALAEALRQVEQPASRQHNVIQHNKPSFGGMEVASL